MRDDALIRPGDAARLLNIDTSTLRRWRREGLIEAVELPSGHSRYSTRVIAEIMRRRSPDAPERAYA